MKVRAHLSYKLYNSLTQCQGTKFKVLQLIPEEYSSGGPIIEYASPSSNLIDIGITKKTFLQLFSESHTIFNSIVAECQNHDSRLPQLSDSELWDVYYATTGLLLCTSENHTSVELHERTLLEIVKRFDNGAEGKEFLKSELELLLSLSICKLSKVNKSSSLWTLIKKIALKLNLNEVLVQNLIQYSLMSCKSHFANYYATSFIRWLINYSRLMKHEGSSMTCIYNQIKNSCNRNLEDSALWGCWEVAMFSDFNGLDFTHRELNRLNRHTKFLTNITIEPVTYLRVEDELMNVSKWLIKIKCRYQTPWIAIKYLLAKLPSDHTYDVYHYLEKELEHHGLRQDIEHINGFFQYKGTDVDQLENLLLAEEVSYIGNLKRVVTSK